MLSYGTSLFTNGSISFLFRLNDTPLFTYHNFFSHSFLGNPLVVPVLQPLKMVVQYVVSLAMGSYHQVLEDKQEKSKYPAILSALWDPTDKHCTF